MLEEKQTKTIWICDIACPQENNIEKKRLEKENQLQGACIRNKREKTWIKSCAASTKSHWWWSKRNVKRTRKHV